MSRLILLAMCAAHALATGCASTARDGASPYRPSSQAARDPQKAQELTLRAAELMSTAPSKAEDMLQQALATDIYHGPAHNNLGVLLLKQGKLYEAANEFEWARKLMPGHPDPRMNLGMVLEQAGRYDEAIAMYATALEVYPGHLSTTQALTRLQVRLRKMDDRTDQMLRDIAIRGDTKEWREWARAQIAVAK